jgi:hypothetical protein
MLQIILLNKFGMTSQLCSGIPKSRFLFDIHACRLYLRILILKGNHIFFDSLSKQAEICELESVKK